ncbi:MAG TPA: N-6 DNA methylase [Virgibacillus sp.]|nr:N-6 DNA methylase [Virgibacillus sp.]HLR69577.1 N-6 DNA methylase [Virgibacillus sp.]
MQNTEELIWEASDILRGQIPIEKMKGYLISMVALAQSEIKQEELTIPEDAQWSRVIKSGENIGKRLNTAGEKLEEVNVFLKNVFHFFPFTKINDATLHRLCFVIDQLPIKEASGSVADSILSLSAASEGKRGGHYLTPVYLCDLAIQLLDIENGSSVFDPAAGVGQLLNRASDYASGLSVAGQEINEETWAIAKLNTILHGNAEMDIRMGDTIRTPQLIDKQGLKTFDYVVMDPPYSLANWGYEDAKNDVYGRFFYGIPPKSRGDMAFILHALASLNEKGKAAIIVPRGVLFRGAGEEKIRKKLIEQDVVETVIGLSSGLLYSSSIPVAVLILNKDKAEERKGKIFFINAEEKYEEHRRQRVLTEEHIREITDIFRSGIEIKKLSRWLEVNKLQDHSLDPSDYFDEDIISTTIGKVQINRETFEQTKTLPLKAAGKLFRGMNPPSGANPESEDASHLMVGLADVQDNQLLSDQLTPISVSDQQNVSRYELKSGDIILSSRGTAIKLAIVPETDQPLLLSNHFIGIRPAENINTGFLKAYLESPVGMFYLINSQKGSVVSVLTAKDIGNIPVPDFPAEQQEKIAERFIQSNQTYIEKLQELEEQRKSAFESLYREMGLSRSYKGMEDKKGNI